MMKPNEVLPLLKREEIQKEAALLTPLLDLPTTFDSSSLDGGAHPRTNVAETFLHLLKGYIGAGMLSLPVDSFAVWHLGRRSRYLLDQFVVQLQLLHGGQHQAAQVHGENDSCAIACRRR